MINAIENELTFPEKAALIVRRTAQFGLTQSQESPEQFERWLLIWACDVAGELGELFEAQSEHDMITECGDVIWGMTALCLLLEIPVKTAFDFCFNDASGSNDALLSALRLLDLCKKVCRDGQIQRPIDRAKITEHLNTIFKFICDIYPIDDALNAVNAKLLKRYPNGYSAEASVNRVA